MAGTGTAWPREIDATGTQTLRSATGILDLKFWTGRTAGRLGPGDEVTLGAAKGKRGAETMGGEEVCWRCATDDWLGLGHKPDESAFVVVGICLDTEDGARVGWPITELPDGTVAVGNPTIVGRWIQGLTGFSVESHTEILIAQRMRQNKRPSFRRTTYELGSGQTTLTTPGNHLFLVRARTGWPTDNAEDRTSTERGWINAPLCWRRTNSSQTTKAGTNVDLSDDETNGNDPRRSRS